MSSSLSSEIEIQCAGESVILRGDGTVLIPKFNALLVADLHLGKSASFRAGGIPVPEGIDQTTLEALTVTLQTTEASQVFFLGDLIHNRDSMTPTLIAEFTHWREAHSKIDMTLVRGNHDRHVRQFPEPWGLHETTSSSVGPFQLLHEISDSLTLDESENAGESAMFQFGGHWHPVISIGRGADRMRLPCFVSGLHHITLPAFGPFKGGMKQTPTKSANFFPICDGKIWKA